MEHVYSSFSHMALFLVSQNVDICIYCLNPSCPPSLRRDAVPAVKAASVRMMVTCLVGCVTAFASLPIGATDAVNSSPDAADTACRAYPFVLSTAFILIFSPLLAKTARIATIFGEKSLQTRVLTDAMLSVAIVMLLLGNWAINFIWLGVDPMEAVEVPGASHTHTHTLTL